MYVSTWVYLKEIFTLMALSLSISWRKLLQQLLQLQLLQKSPLAKQSQYLRAEQHSLTKAPSEDAKTSAQNLRARLAATLGHTQPSFTWFSSFCEKRSTGMMFSSDQYRRERLVKIMGFITWQLAE